MKKHNPLNSKEYRSKSGQTIILVGLAVTTLVVSPYFSLDPINLPKALTLTLTAFLITPIIFWSTRYRSLSSMFRWLGPIFIVLASLSIYLNANDREQQLVGVFGRSTGIITYVSLFVIAIASSLLYKLDRQFVSKAIDFFCRTSYFITFYTVLQYAELDPIPWSQKFPVATLGNINFMSAFLGMASVVFLSRTFNDEFRWSQRIFFVSIAIVNYLLIVKSGSIQGIICSSVGIFSIAIITLWTRLSLFSRLAVLVLSLLAFPLVLLGSMGKGPLSQVLVQTTAVFRLDYWTAGINMILFRPVFGLGFDSYGDYYREFRTLEATLRTGPQRVSNTAHNVFIDFGVNLGLIALGLLIILILGTLAGSFFSCANAEFQSKKRETEAFGVTTAWCTFLLISINQIGVTCWGFLFFGILVAMAEEQLRFTKLNQLRVSEKERGAKVVVKPEVKSESQLVSGHKSDWAHITAGLMMFGFLLIGVCAYSVAFYKDAKFFDATKSGSVLHLESSLEGLLVPSYYYEKAAIDLRSLRHEDAAVEVSRAGVVRFPRNYPNWAILATSPLVGESERKDAVRQLFRLDPHNPDLKKEFGRFVSRG